MGITKIKTFRLTCDGQVLSAPILGMGRVETQCPSTEDMQAESLNDLKTDLRTRRDSELREQGGWRWVDWSGELICPRHDHLGEYSETGK